MLHCTGALTDTNMFFWYTQSSNLKFFIRCRETLLVELAEIHMINYTLGCNVYEIKFVISLASLFGFQSVLSISIVLISWSHCYVRN